MTHYFAPTVQQLPAKKSIIHRQQPHDEPRRKGCTRTSTYCSGKTWATIQTKSGIAAITLPGEYRRLVCPVSGSRHRNNNFSITSLPSGHYFPKVWELCTDYFSHSGNTEERNLLVPLKVLPGSKRSRYFGWKHSFGSKTP